MLERLSNLASQPSDASRQLQEQGTPVKPKTWWRFLNFRNLPQCPVYQYAANLLRPPLLLGLLFLILVCHLGHTLHSGLHIALYLLEACFVGSITYLLGKKHCIETIRAIANEAAVRLVALYRQNEDLVGENQELEAELHAIAQHSHPPLHAGSPADLILEVVDSMLEGGSPRPGDLLLLREYILSSHQENLYQPLDLYQQLHTYTMEPDVEEALCHQLLGYSVAREAPRWHSMPDNATRQLSGLSDPSVQQDAYKPRLSEQQLSASATTKASEVKSEQDTLVAAAQADEGLKNMLAALACDTSVLDRQNRLPGHQSSKVHLLRTSSSIPSQLSQLQGPPPQQQQQQQQQQHQQGSVENYASGKDQLMVTSRLASDASSMSNLCPSPLVTSSYGGSLRGSGGAYGSTGAFPGTPPTAAPAHATFGSKPGTMLGSGKPSGSGHQSPTASGALSTQHRKDRLRAMSSLGLSQSQRHQRARSFTSIASEEKGTQHQQAPLPSWLSPGEMLTAPSLPAHTRQHRPPRPSRSTSIILGKKACLLSPRQSSQTQQGIKEHHSSELELLQPSSSWHRLSFTSKSNWSGESQSQSEKLLKLKDRQQSFGGLPSIQSVIALAGATQTDSAVSSPSPFGQQQAQSARPPGASSRTNGGVAEECEGAEGLGLNKLQERLVQHRGSGHEGKASGAASARGSGPLLGVAVTHAAASDSKIPPTEASVYQDLIKAAQNCERHELDEAETEAAEQLYSSGAGRLPSQGGAAATAGLEEGEVQPRSLSWSIAKPCLSGSQISAPLMHPSSMAGNSGSLFEGPPGLKPAAQHLHLVQPHPTSHPTSPMRKASSARQRRSSTGGLPKGGSALEPIPDGLPVSSLLEPIPSGRPLLAGGLEVLHSSSEKAPQQQPLPQQQQQSQQQQLKAVRTQQPGGLAMGLPVIKDLAEGGDSPRSSAPAQTGGLQVHVPEEHGSSGASTPKGFGHAPLTPNQRSGSGKKRDAKGHLHRDPSAEDGSQANSPRASSMAALQSSAKQWMKNLLEPSSSRHRKPVKSRTFNVGTHSRMDTEHQSSGSAKGTLLHVLLAGRRSKKSSRGQVSSEGRSSPRGSTPGSEGPLDAERKHEHALSSMGHAPSFPLSAKPHTPPEPRPPPAQPSPQAHTPASTTTKVSSSRAPSMTALQHCADATPSLTSFRSGSDRDPSSHGATSTSHASEERLGTQGGGVQHSAWSGARHPAHAHARAFQAGNLDHLRPLSPCSDTAADTDGMSERTLPELLAKQSNMSRSVRARASSALSFEDTAKFNYSEQLLGRSPPSQSFLRSSQASGHHGSSIELSVGSFGPSKVTNDSQKVVDSSETLVGSPPTPFALDHRHQLLAQRPSLGPRAPPVQEMEAVLEHAYVSCTFDAFHLNTVTQGHPLSTLGYFLFHKSGLISTFCMHPVKLARFLRKMEAGYRARNPYHNAIHAADVLQTLHVIILRGGMETQGFADRLSVLAALLAAIMHDYEHMGLTNDFLINSSSKLAIRYNDRAPLENHHLAAGFTVLCSPDQNFLSSLPKSDYARMRKIIIDLVLATDMKQHFALVGQFNAVVRRVKPRQRAHDNGPGSPNMRGLVQPLRKAESLGRALSQSLATVAGGSHSGGSLTFPQRMSMDITETAVQQLRAAMDETSARPARHSHSAHRVSPHTPCENERLAPTDDHGQHNESSTSGERSTGGGENRLSGNSCHWAESETLPLDDAQRLLVLQIALKCADLGHATEDLGIHLRWVRCLEEEFYRQGDREKAAGLPISPLFDRTKPGVTKSQVGFFDVVVLPLFQAFAKAVPGACPLVEKAEQNYRYWKSMSPTQ